jgi:predicted membrane-bound spermidine synthase
MAWLMVSLFFLSGLTALVGEVVWMRMLGLVLGNTVWAASTAVAMWMAGMAIGARFGARLAARTQLHLRWYGVAEIIIGVFFLASPALHRLLLAAGAGVGEDLGRSLALGMAQRFALAALALALPTILMGLTLPLLVERLRGRGLASRVSLLYGVNTLGAAAGVFSAAYLLLPNLGERASLSAAALLCAAVGVSAVLLERSVPRAEMPPAAEPSTPVRTSFLLLVAAMGLSALAAELVWVRILVLHLGSRVYAFALLLGVYLLGIAIGSLLVRAAAPKISDPARALARVQVLAAVALVGQLVALGFAGDLIVWLSQVVPLRATFAAAQGVFFTAVTLLFLPVTVLFGASFPLAVAADPVRRSPGEHTGMIAAANTVGGIAGAVAAPFLLVPWIGCQRTLLVLAAVHIVVALCLSRARLVLTAATLVAVSTVAIWTSLPSDWVLRQATAVDSERTELVELIESLSATVLVKRYDDVEGTWYSLELNGVNVAGTEPALLAVQQLQGNLPMLQAHNTRRVLHVGFGSGGTCWSVTRYPIDRVDVVEIAPEVLRASDTHFADINHGVLDDPAVNVVVNDGRNFLLATDERYDVVLSDSIHPLYAGNSTLYTREYFEMCRAHLEPGGVTSMWLPIYSLDRGSLLRILRAFNEVFPRTAIWYDVSTPNEYTVVTGMLEPGPVEIMWDRANLPEVAGSLAIANVYTREHLMANLLLGPEQVARLTADTPAFVDDFPYVEYTAGRLLARDLTWYDNLVMLYQARSAESCFPAGTGDWDAASAYRDRRLGEILDQVRENLEGGL